MGGGRGSLEFWKGRGEILSDIEQRGRPAWLPSDFKGLNETSVRSGYESYGSRK